MSKRIQQTDRKYYVVQKFTGILCTGKLMCRNGRLRISRRGLLASSHRQIVGLRRMDNGFVSRDLPSEIYQIGSFFWSAVRIDITL